MLQEKRWTRLMPCPLAVFILGLMTSTVFLSPAFGHTIPLTDRQKIGAAEHIVVATVEAKNVRWNPQRTLIVTDYTLRIGDRLKGSAADTVQVVMPGGTLDGETHESCLSVPLEPGERYVLFLNNLERPSLTPFTGASQGVFREIRTKAGRSLVAQGQRPDVPLKMNGQPIEFATFVASLRDLIADVQAKLKDGVTTDLENVLAGAEDRSLPAQEYVPLEKGGALPAGESSVPLEAPEAELPPPPAEAGFPLVPSVEAKGKLVPNPRARDLDSPREKYLVQGAPPSPIVFNPLPPKFPWAPLDQQQMSYWNRYAQNLFRVRTATGTWAFRNGVYDIAGFPSNATMIQQFGQGWGNDVLGVTWTLSVGGRIIEADVALNPAFTWTRDSAVALQTTNRSYLFQQTMLHELGHAWGLKHPWETQDVWWDSVMNYSPKEYRVPVLWTDDTTAAYRTYPGISIRDGAISVWTTRDRFLDNNPTYVPFQVSPPSGPFATTNFKIVNPVKIENTGTVPLSNPVIEVWASSRRYSFTGAFLVKTVRLQQTIPTFYTLSVDLGSFRMPSSARSGTYWIAIVLRDSADKYQANNVSWW